MDEKNEKISGDIRLNIHVSEKLDNFWYHYKWHTVFGIFAVIVITVLTLQLCTKTDYDIHIIYAGEKNISKTSLSGDGSSEYSKIIEALKATISSGESEENVNIDLQNLYILSEEEFKEATKDSKDPMKVASLETSIRENRDLLHNYLMYAEHYLAFLSEDIFLDYEDSNSTSIFAPLASYVKDNGEYKYVNERGIYLSSLEIYNDPRLSVLPEDTVVCIRLPGVLGAKDDGKTYAKAEELLRAILSYKE